MHGVGMSIKQWFFHLQAQTFSSVPEIKQVATFIPGEARCQPLFSLVFRKGNFSHHQPLMDWSLRETKWAPPKKPNKTTTTKKSWKLKETGKEKTLHPSCHPDSLPARVWLAETKILAKGYNCFSGRTSQSDEERDDQNGCLDFAMTFLRPMVLRYQSANLYNALHKTVF